MVALPMMTLHDTIELTKKVLIFGLLGVIGIFVLIMLFRFGGILKERLFPTPLPAALTEFGKLPKIHFPERDSPPDYSYILDTTTGTYPELGDRANVHKLITPLPEFYDLTRAKTKAKTLNFTGAPVPVQENIYRWTDNSELQRNLIMNVVTKNFSLTSNYQAYQPLHTAVNLPDTIEAIALAKAFLTSISSYPETINEASTSAKTLALQNGNLVNTTSLQNAQIIRVDFYHTEVDKLPIYYPGYPNSLQYVLLGSSPSRPVIIEAQFNDQPLSNEFSDYPIKTAEQAFKELQQHKAHIASYEGKAQEIKINEIKLGYYLGMQNQEYLMPIIVFTGEDGFTAFVSAVADDFTQ
jgi:hypothetical protein